MTLPFIPTASRLPSLLNARDTPVRRGNENFVRSLRVDTSQILAMLSLPKDASSLPSREKARMIVPSAGPGSRNSSAPVAVSQKQIGPFPAEASDFPLGAKANVPRPTSLILASSAPVAAFESRI